MELSGRTLRVAALAVLLRTPSTWSTGAIRRELEADGDRIAGPDPNKTLGDALGREARKGRAVRVSRGWYRAGSIPKTTAWRIRRWRFLLDRPDPRWVDGAWLIPERNRCLKDPMWPGEP